jgi:hypothetical protein
MGWFRTDDGFWSHPKTLRAKNEAAGAFQRMGSYCAQHLTDGAVDREIALMIAERQEVLDRLVNVGFLEVTDTGYQLHNYLKFNPSREKVELERDKTAKRVQNHRSAVGNGVTSRVTNAATNGSSNSRRSPTDNADTNPVGTRAPSHPIPSQKGEGESRASACARTRDEPPITPPPPPPVEELTSEEADRLDAIAEGAEQMPGRWDPRGARWQRKALAVALAERGISADDAFMLGEYLATPEAERTHEIKSFSVDWIVFGTSSAPEFKRLDWIWREAKRWNEQPASTAAPTKAKVAAKRAAAPKRSSADVRVAMGKVLEGFKRLPQPLAAVATDDEELEDPAQEPNATAAEQRGIEPIGDVLDAIVGAAR